MDSSSKPQHKIPNFCGIPAQSMDSSSTSQKIPKFPRTPTPPLPFKPNPRSQKFQRNPIHQIPTVPNSRGFFFPTLPNSLWNFPDDFWVALEKTGTAPREAGMRSLELTRNFLILGRGNRGQLGAAIGIFPELSPGFLRFQGNSRNSRLWGQNSGKE